MVPVICALMAQPVVMTLLLGLLLRLCSCRTRCHALRRLHAHWFASCSRYCVFLQDLLVSVAARWFQCTAAHKGDGNSNNEPLLLPLRQVHTDTEATLQCVLCLRAKVDLRKSYHCSTDCFRKHWHLHRDLHGQPSQRNGAPCASASLHTSCDAQRRIPCPHPSFTPVSCMDFIVIIYSISQRSHARCESSTWWSDSAFDVFRRPLEPPRPVRRFCRQRGGTRAA